MHVLHRVLSLVAVGVKIFPFSGTEFKGSLCRLLTLLGQNDVVATRPLQPVDIPLGRFSLQANGNRTLLNVVLEDDLEDDWFGIDGDLWHTS